MFAWMSIYLHSCSSTFEWYKVRMLQDHRKLLGLVFVLLLAKVIDNEPTVLLHHYDRSVTGPSVCREGGRLRHSQCLAMIQCHLQELCARDSHLV